MKRCEACGVFVENDLNACPLCKGQLQETKGCLEEDFPQNPQDGGSRRAAKWVALGTLVAVGGCIAFNLLYTGYLYWSGVALLGVLYLWLSVRFLSRSRRNLGMLALVQILGISGISFLVDAATGYSSWSANYVVPFVIISAAGLVSAFIWANPRRFREYILYQLGIALLGAAASGLALSKWTTVRWTGVVGACYAALTILGLLVCHAKKTRHELKKRFHF